MNKESQELIERLAEKLGTTTEYLWSILLQQAPISASIGLLHICLSLFLAILLIVLHLRFSKGENQGEGVYYNHDGVVVLMMVCTIFTIFYMIVSIAHVNNIINGYFHPEYWALNEILQSID